ncbi:glycosyltransferase family 4 protein [Metabacillus sp. JX24]|uniref:glycosyltransferase family 4 protein n=1 Tax=Metabacillus sp. JX24 TaxID=3240759 RepID=UPI00350FE244
MNIFHGTTEIAGQMGILSSALEKKGYHSLGYNTFHSYLGYKDYLVNTDEAYLEKNQDQLIADYDLFHFHYNTTMCKSYSDLEKIHALGKKMVMHHWGNDVRFHEQAKEKNPFAYTGDSPPNEVMHERLTKVSSFISEAIVQDYEVYEYVKEYYQKVHVLPIAIDLTHFKPAYPSKDKKVPLILHAPTNPDFKGTRHVEAAIEKLRETYEFTYKRIEKMNHDEVISLYKEADIIVDQILCGSYGLLSVESMALGKPVVTFIRPDLVPTFPDTLPIVNANPETVYHAVERLLKFPELREDIGRQGRKYAEENHCKHVVVDELIKIYQNL